MGINNPIQLYQSAFLACVAPHGFLIPSGGGYPPPPPPGVELDGVQVTLDGVPVTLS